MKKLIIMLFVGLGLASCESREDQYYEDMINSCVVKAMTGIEVHWRAYSTCTGRDTSGVKEFASCYVVNIGVLPEVEDVRYSEYEFYAMIDGQKIVGGQMVLNGLQEETAGQVYGLVFDQFSHNELNLLIPLYLLGDAEFYVETPGNIRQIQLGEIYRGVD
jgi:hypothetical protein